MAKTRAPCPGSIPGQGIRLHMPQEFACLCGLPDGSGSKEYTCNAGDTGSTPGSGRSPGGGNGNPL